MKVVLDLEALVADGSLSPEEAVRLAGLGKRSTGTLAFNLLVGFGVMAVAAGALALVPAPSSAIVIGFMVALAGAGIGRAAGDDWNVLAQICIVVGALIGGGGMLTVGEFAPGAFLTVALFYAVGAGVVRNALLAGLAVLGVSGAVGAETGYMAGDGYAAALPESSLAILVMVLLAGFLALLARAFRDEAARLLGIGAATALVVANFGFWVGSLWGDELWLGGELILDVPEQVFALVWAVLLIVTGVMAARVGARWTLNCAAVFGAVHLFSQWFDRLEASPESVLGAGIVALCLAVGLAFVNRRLPG